MEPDHAGRASEYQQALVTAGVKEYNFSSLEGFIVAKAFTEGLRRAGRDLTRERLITALEACRAPTWAISWSASAPPTAQARGSSI